MSPGVTCIFYCRLQGRLCAEAEGVEYDESAFDPDGDDEEDE